LGSCVGHVDIVVAAEVRCVQRRARLVLGIRIRRGRDLMVDDSLIVFTDDVNSEFLTESMRNGF
jgi:hypothetical protein